ncbi:helix-turn-helix domain-containing protein [Actinomadura roseirufa]|uniref:helix-turn-helix domain-containing protein n=1 Tax=Actinomadura roseirufa TaxID=2094049 RepID=UPI001F5F834A|nr:helix-turn-helix transcriptional regulator [Actinomadura roseirufa]
MTFGEKLRELLTEQKISQRQMADLVPCDDGYVSRVARGLLRPSEKMAARFDEILNANGSLAALRPPSPSGKPGGTVDQSPTPDQRDDDVKRRAALQIVTALAAGTAIPPRALETVLSGIDDALGNPLDLDEWEAVVHEHGQLLTARHAGALINPLTADLVAVGDLLKRHRNDSAHLGLLRVSAGLSSLLAIDLGDVGEQRGARLSWATARRAADASGDRDLRVWVRGREAAEGQWSGRPDTLVNRLAAEAVAIAENRPSPGLASALGAQAYASAKRSDHAGARTALSSRAKAIESQRLRTSGLSSPQLLGPTSLHWREAHVLIALGDTRAATGALDQARALHSTTMSGPVSTLEMLRAFSLVKSREFAAGLEHAVTTIEAWPLSASRRHLVGEILGSLPDKARTLPAAQELRTLTAARPRPALI